MTYNKDELIALMENANVIVKIGNKYGVNTVFQNFIKTAKRASGQCKDYPEEFRGLSDMLIYNKVIIACGVPTMYKGDITYFVRTQSKASVKKLKDILQDVDIDYNIFIEKTSGFYSSGSAVPGFAKYLVEELWRAIYDEESIRRVRKGVL